MQETHNLYLIFNSNRAAMLLLQKCGPKNILIIVIGKIQQEPYLNLHHPGNKMLLAHTLSRLADQGTQKPTGREAIVTSH
jgi:hypothetical protein